MMEFLPYLFVIAFVNGYVHAEGTTVRTTSGKISGSRISVLNTDIDVFLGIPFAKPPVGDLRFRRPEPVEPWNGVKETKEFSASCIQYNSKKYDKIKDLQLWKLPPKISEDCLYLNIWTPTTARNSTSNLTTMIWIHGGAFLAGSSSIIAYNGQWLAASENVIVASLNYRLGPFGFLYLNDKRAPGNMGLLDQNLAIKWIRDNIASFGGDPNKLTLFGESAGSASVSLHVVSPLSRKLFNNAIMMSGTYNADWGMKTLEDNKNRAKAMAEVINCPSNDTEKMLDCFLKANTTDLALGQFNKLDTFIKVSFGPVIDNYFLFQNSIKPLSNKKLKKDILAGFVKNEGSLFLLSYPKYFSFNSSAPIGKDVEENLIRTITANNYINKVQFDMINYLYGSHVYAAPQTDKYRYILERVASDYSFKCPTLEFAKQFSTHSNVHIYSFEYQTKSSPLLKVLGVLHGYDTFFIFAHALYAKHVSAEDKAVTKKITSLFTNFSKSGNPNNGDCSDCTSEPWTKFKPKSQKYVVIDDPSKTEMKDNYMNNICGFWSDIFPILHEPFCPVPTSGSENSWCFQERILTSSMAVLLSLLMSYTTLCY
ncbi:acetylcholinesterase-like [Argonauta hians]